jgi:hypothetical protein
VRISGKYIPVSIALIEGTDFEVEDMGDLVEKTVFGDTARSRFLTLQDASGSFSVISSLSSTYNATTLRALMRAGTPVLLEYRPGGSTAYWRAWVLLSDGSEKASVDGRIEGSMKFEAVTVGPSTGESEYAVPTWGT